MLCMEVSMAYVRPNFKSKKELKDAVAAGKTVTVFQPGLGSVPLNGEIDVEGPHFPQPHRWYGYVTLEAGRVVKVR